MFRAALAETPEETLTEIIARLEAIAAAIKRADAVLTANADGDTGANFKPTYDLISQMKAAVQSFTSTPAAPSRRNRAGGRHGADAGAGGGGPRIAGRVETREDVIKALDAIADYYRRREPSSPVPAALQECREWVTLDFLALLEDIAPELARRGQARAGQPAQTRGRFELVRARLEHRYMLQVRKGRAGTSAIRPWEYRHGVG